jgi:hypothetical protein
LCRRGGENAPQVGQYHWFPLQAVGLTSRRIIVGSDDVMDDDHTPLGILVIISGLRQQPTDVLGRMNFAAAHDNLRFAANFAESRKLAASLLPAGN